MVGGVDNDDTHLDATEVYSGGQWRTVGALPAAVEGLRGVTIANSVYITGWDTQAGRGARVPISSLLIGGGVGTKVQYSIWKYDDEDEEWRTTTMKMERKRYWHAASIFDPNSNIHMGYVCQYRLH